MILMALFVLRRVLLVITIVTLESVAMEMAATGRVRVTKICLFEVATDPISSTRLGINTVLNSVPTQMTLKNETYTNQLFPYDFTGRSISPLATKTSRESI